MVTNMSFVTANYSPTRCFRPAMNRTQEGSSHHWLDDFGKFLRKVNILLIGALFIFFCFQLKN